MPGKRIEVDEDTFLKLTDLGRRRMATFQELIDEALADLLKKHGVPVDLKDALKKSVRRTAYLTIGTARPATIMSVMRRTA